MPRTISAQCAALALLIGMPAAASAADDSDAGMLAFNNHCRQCHSYKQGDNRLGPSLYGVVGRKAGTAPNYGNYSDSVKSSGITWTPENIDKWITNPEAFIPNNNMKPFVGVADTDQRQKIISFLAADTKMNNASTGRASGQ